MAKITIDKLEPASPTTGAENLILSQNGETVRLPLSLLPVGNSVAYKGSAVPATDPGTPTTAQYYIATEAGTYTNFLDSTSTAITVAAGEDFVILSFDGTNWTKQVVNIDLSGYASTQDVLGNTNAINGITGGNMIGSVSTGYIDYHDGDFIGPEQLGSAGNNRTSAFVKVDKDSQIQWAGTSYASSVRRSPITFWDSNKNYLGYYSIPSGDYPPDLEIKVSDYYPDAKYIRATYYVPTGNEEMFLNVYHIIQQSRVEGVSALSNNFDALQSLIFESDISSVANLHGYISSEDGERIVNDRYLSSDFIRVEEGLNVFYSGTLTSAVAGVSVFDSDKNFISTLITTESGPANYIEKNGIIPSGAKYIKISYRAFDPNTEIEDTHIVKLSIPDESKDIKLTKNLALLRGLSVSISDLKFNATKAVIGIIGDSWTAREGMTSQIKELLYDKYGFGGEGWTTFTNTPTQGSASNSLRTTKVFTGTITDTDNSPDSPHLGLHNFSVGATAAITSNFTDAKLFFYKNTGTHSFRYNIDGGVWTTVDASHTSKQISTVDISGLTDGEHVLNVEVLEGSVSFTGVNLLRGTGGIVFHGFANGGSTAQTWASCSSNSNWRFHFQEIGLKSCLILLGTNDIRADVTPDDYLGYMKTIESSLHAISSLMDVTFIATPDNSADTIYTMEQYMEVLDSDRSRNGLPLINMYYRFGEFAVANAMGLMDGGSPSFHMSSKGEKHFARNIVDILARQ